MTRSTILGALFVAWLFAARGLAYVAQADPDRYYHFAIARLTWTHGLLRVLPQAEDLGWGSYFPDKEFLFHALSAFAYGIGKDNAVIWLVAAFGGIVLVLTTWGVESVGPKRRSLWENVALAVAFTILAPVFTTRLVLVRPHVLGIVFFMTLVVGVVRRNRWVSFAGGAGFALAYHALFIPFGVLCAAGASASLSRPNKPLLMAAVAGATGLFVGALINPYFPSTLVMMGAVVEIAFNRGRLPQASYGTELAPYPLSDFCRVFAFPLLVVAIGALSWRRMRQRDDIETIDRGWLISATAGLWGLAVVSPRALEYAFPLTALVGSMAIASGRLLWGMVGVGILLQGPFWQMLMVEGPGELVDPAPAHFSAIEKIPLRPTAKIFNCDWSVSPYVFYARPELRFVDILDPTLLMKAAPEKFVLRQALLQGQVREPYKVIKDIFKADFVVCARPEFNRRLMQSERFREVHGAPLTVVKVFEVL